MPYFAGECSFWLSTCFIVKTLSELLLAPIIGSFLKEVDMGLCPSQEEKNSYRQSKAIDKKIKECALEDQNVVKLLLLGAGECGKSTVLKQMRILHSDGFSDEELMQQRSVVYSNTVHAMESILIAMAEHNIPFANANSEGDAKMVFDIIKLGVESDRLSPELANSLKNLWDDCGVSQVTYGRRIEYGIDESAKFFLDNIDRIARDDYKPTQQDILLTRIKTTGIVEMNFDIKNIKFRVFDVGGQRSERKKWIHCFENVNAIIFIAAVSEYDEVLYEDQTTNRMVESMRLFESICNSRWFISTSIILFLNKKDLFHDKIKVHSIKIAFPEYNGPQTYDGSIAYIRKKFESLNANPNKGIFVHETCATDTNQVQIILTSVLSMILQANLHNSGLY